MRLSNVMKVLEKEEEHTQKSDPSSAAGIATPGPHRPGNEIQLPGSPGVGHQGSPESERPHAPGTKPGVLLLNSSRWPYVALRFRLVLLRPIF
jgi:hypothetical protein